MQLVRRSAIELEIARTRRDVGFRLVDRLTCVAAFELSEFGMMLEDLR